MDQPREGTIYFVRHGESEANARRIIANRGTGLGLTERGRRQAMALAKALAAARIVAVYHSPLDRAAETAAILAAAWGAPCREAAALGECDCGVCEGREDEAAWALHDAVMTRWRGGEWEARIPGGESLVDARDRFVPFVRQIMGTICEMQSAVCLVTHGALLSSVLPLVLGGLDVGFAAAHPLGNAGYVAAEVRADRLECVRWTNDLPGA